MCFQFHLVSDKNLFAPKSVEAKIFFQLIKCKYSVCRFADGRSYDFSNNKITTSKQINCTIFYNNNNMNVRLPKGILIAIYIYTQTKQCSANSDAD